MAAQRPIMSIIQRLPQDTVNRIAAGEVVERPASAVKELVENAIDAGATQIFIRCDQGGLSRIIVEDNGSGMQASELSLAVERHATSKLKPQADGTWDLMHISTLGFRGEALPSMGSVARLCLVSKPKTGSSGVSEAAAITVDAGKLSEVRPSAFAGDHGTRIELSDLFYATPARLKFMKSERAENMAITEEVKRQAMAHEAISFTLELEGKRQLHLPAEPLGFEGRLKRLSALMGKDFAPNAMLIDQEREAVRLSGYAGLPTFSRGNGLHQYLFVNNRPVRDKLIIGALRGAYAEYLARDRHPLAALFIDIEPHLLDVNVHPAKTEVRFREPQLVRGLMIGALKHALLSAGHRASSTVADQALRHLQPRYSPYQPSLAISALTSAQIAYQTFAECETIDDFAPSAWVVPDALVETGFAEAAPVFDGPVISQPPAVSHPLGAARAQIHATYIIAQTDEGIIIVDQHAAHERLVYEQMKSAIETDEIKRQTLLIPQIIDLEAFEVGQLMAWCSELESLGLTIEAFGPTCVLVREIPALLAHSDLKTLIRNLVDEILEQGQVLSLKEALAHLIGDQACRASVRAGRRLTGDEMNALLRQMEATPHSGQCNHGRPTYVELKLKDIEKLFGRR
jgi:DNA mismatch repair protein MutL